MKLLDKKLHQKGIRVVTLSSSAHSYSTIYSDDLHYKKGRKYSKWEAYGQSKLANLLFAKSFADRFKDKSDLLSLSVHPGVINTNLGK